MSEVIESASAEVVVETQTNPVVEAAAEVQKTEAVVAAAGSEQKSDAGAVSSEIKYELKAPEGSNLDQARIDKVVSFAKERGLSNDAAQAILDSEHQAVSEFVESVKPGGSLWVKQLDKWEEELAKDSVVGGNPIKLKENIEIAKKGLDRFADDGLKEFLEATGNGSNPAVVRLFYKLGKAMSDDKSVHGDPANGQHMSQQDRHIAALYGEKKT